MSGASRTLVLVLNWNGLEDTRACLRELTGAKSNPFDVWVLDNGSSPAQTQSLSDEFPNSCEVFRSEKNMGFAGGMNWLWHRMLERDPHSERYSEVLFLNNDARISPAQLGSLTLKLRARSDVAVLGPAILESGTARREPIGPGWIRFWSGRTVYEAAGTCTADKACDLVHGAVFIIRRTAVPALPFDPGYFAYYEETELCARLARLGWVVLWTPDVRCEHLGESSSRRVSGLTEYLMMRNRVRFLLRNSSGPARLCALVIVTPLYGVRRVVRAFLHNNFYLIRCNITGFLDGFTGRNRILDKVGAE